MNVFHIIIFRLYERLNYSVRLLLFTVRYVRCLDVCTVRCLYYYQISELNCVTKRAIVHIGILLIDASMRGMFTVLRGQ